MEHIRDAIARAKQGRDKLPIQEHDKLKSCPIGNDGIKPGGARPAPRQNLTPLDRLELQDNRIMAYDGIDRRSAHYDMLRTQVLQILDEAHIKTLAVTSPRPGCGKTVTAVNLAFSIARQHEQSVLLVDLDLRKPMVSSYLGIRPEHGVHDVVEGRCRLNEAVIRPDLGQGRLSILAPAAPIASPTELIVSSKMKALTERFKTDKRFTVIIYDLPPMLSADDFLGFLPQIECAMLVAAVGETAVQEIAECERLIGDDKFLGCVLNKTAKGEAGYTYYS